MVGYPTLFFRLLSQVRLYGGKLTSNDLPFSRVKEAKGCQLTAGLVRAKRRLLLQSIDILLDKSA